VAERIDEEHFLRDSSAALLIYSGRLDPFVSPSVSVTTQYAAYTSRSIGIHW